MRILAHLSPFSCIFRRVLYLRLLHSGDLELLISHQTGDLELIISHQTGVLQHPILQKPQCFRPLLSPIFTPNPAPRPLEPPRQFNYLVTPTLPAYN